MVVYRFLVALNQISWLPGSLPVEFKSESLESTNDFPIPETREPPHSSCNHNGEVLGSSGGRKGRYTFALTSGLNQSPRDVASDFQRLSNRTTLRDKSRELL
jgi:hypothetical protein